MTTLMTIATTLATASLGFLLAAGLAPAAGFAPWQDSLMAAGAWNGVLSWPFYGAALVTGIAGDIQGYLRRRRRS